MLQNGEIIKIPWNKKTECSTFKWAKGAKAVEIYHVDTSSYYIGYYVIDKNGKRLDQCSCLSKRMLEEIKRKSLSNKITKFMATLKENVVMMLKGEPERSFIKHGVTDAGGAFTPQGQEVFLQYMLSKHGADFKKDVLDNIVDEKK